MLAGQITPMILTYNEAPNIRRTIEKLLWADRVLVIDSGSTDETTAILGDYRQVQVIHHPFQDFAAQCNFGLTQVTTRWVLSLDADYLLSDALVSELQALTPSDAVAGYRAKFVYRIHGRPLRASLYPPRVVLHRRDRAVYRNEGHGHRVSVDGDVLPLAGVIYHDDRKPLARWFVSQRQYARAEAASLLELRDEPATWTDSLRLMAWPAPFAAFLYVLFGKRCLLDGWSGWYYALQRAVAEAMIALEIIDRRLRGPGVAGTERVGAIGKAVIAGEGSELSPHKISINDGAAPH